MRTHERAYKLNRRALLQHGAAAVTVSVAAPTLATAAPASPEERIAYHLAKLCEAYSDHYGGLPVDVRGADLPPDIVCDPAADVCSVKILTVGHVGGRPVGAPPSGRK